jgi:nicotinamide-nucleotide amidase
MISKVFQKLLKNGLTIGFAESMTGGFSTYQLIQNPGASKVIKGSIIAYSDHEKVHLLGLDPLLISTLSSVSKEVAIEMAKSIQKILNADIGVGITGNAGPTIQEGSHALEAFIAIVYQDQIIHERIDLLKYTRVEAIKHVTQVVYQQLDQLLSQNSN